MEKKTTRKVNHKYKTRVDNPGLNIVKVNIFLLIAFSIAISFLLFFRGGYFERQLLPNLVFILLVFIVFLFMCIKHRLFSIFDNPIDLLLFGIFIMYLISITYGVNKRSSVIESTRHLAFFVVYILAKYLSNDKKNKNIILNVILLGGFVVSIIGVGAATGSWVVPGAIVSNRISSTLQYPNTLAAYASALYFLAFTLLINTENKQSKLLYSLYMGIFVFMLITTFSRAMWLMFPIIAILYFIVIPNQRKMETFIYMICSAMLSLPAGFLFTRLMDVDSPRLWVYFAMASIGTAILMQIASLGEKFYRRISIKKLVLLLLMIVLVVVTLIFYAINQTTEIKLENYTAEAKTSSFYRNINKTMPGNSYKLEYDYFGENNSDSAYIGTIQINNLDSKGNSTTIIRENIVELSGANSIEFTTSEDSAGVIVYIRNSQPNTSITVKNARITDVNSEEVINIPLRYKYIPESIIRRISSISTTESSFVARMRFNMDGLKIVKDYPIFGAGGGGWESLYQKYQSYPYWTTLAHNYFLQLCIEIGTIGILLMSSLIIILSYFTFKRFKGLEDIKHKTLLAGLFITIFTLLSHSIVDFDMSLGAYAIVVWTIIGVLTSNINFESSKTEKYMSKLTFLNSKVTIYLIVLICLIFIVNSFSILSSGKYIRLATEAYERQDLDGVTENFEKAAKRDKLKSSIKLDLANAYNLKYDITDDETYIIRAKELTDDYLYLASTDSITQANGASFYLSIGDFNKGIELLEKSVELQPMRTENYIQKLDGYLSIFQYYYENGDIDSAMIFLKNALSVKDDIKEVNKRAYKPLNSNNDLVKRIGEAEYLLRNYDLIDYIYSNYDSISFAYYFDIDINQDAKLDMLYTSVPKGSNFSFEVLNEDEEKFIRMTNTGEVQGFNYINPLTLEPDTNYVVELKARGSVNPETFKVYAWSTNSKEKTQGVLEDIELTDDWKTYSLEFTTDSDVEPGKQYIRLQHSGNDEGYIDIKELVIFKRN